MSAFVEDTVEVNKVKFLFCCHCCHIFIQLCNKGNMFRSEFDENVNVKDAEGAVFKNS